MTRKKVLAIGGTDPTCGAGVQLDAFTIARFGAFPYTAVTSVVAQNSGGVLASEPVPIELLKAQLDAVLMDGPVDAIKTGMLSSAEAVRAIMRFAKKANAFLIIDPVLAASDGTPLFEGDLAVYEELLAAATLVTPNAPEAEILTGLAVGDEPAMVSAAETIIEIGAQAVLVKGGHVEGVEAADLLMDTAKNARWFRLPRRPMGKVRGTGCMLASAIAASIAQGVSLADAVEQGKSFVTDAIAGAIMIGQANRQATFFATGETSIDSRGSDKV